MGYLGDLREHAQSFLRGLTTLLGGFALIVVGTVAGYADSRWLDVLAGTLATVGIILAFCGFFVYVLPPLLPAK